MVGPTKLWAALAVGAVALTACGGGGGSGGSGGGNSNTVAQTASACTISGGPFVAISLTGQVGQAQFSNGGSTLTYSSYPSSFTNNTLSGSLDLVQDPNNTGVCMDSGSATNSMRTTIQSSGIIGISHAKVNGADEPVVLLAQSALVSNSLSNLAGTYDLLRYQTDTTNGGQTRSSYATINVSNGGAWSMCKNAPSCSSPTATGSFGPLAGSNVEFEFASAGLVRGDSFVVNDGASQILVTAEHDTGSGLVQGLHFGLAQAPWSPLSGPYAVNTTDGVAQQTIVYGSSAVSGSGPTPVPLTTDSPIQGLATATAADGVTLNYLIASPSGLLVDVSNTGNNFGSGPGFLAFGIVPSTH